MKSRMSMNFGIKLDKAKSVLLTMIPKTHFTQNITCLLFWWSASQMCTDKPIVGQDQLTIDDEKAVKNEWMILGPHLSTCKCTLGANSKPNCRLTASSIRFRAVVIV